MPVVMVGSPGGALGGSGGSAFGSGLGGLQGIPTKPFTPALEIWSRRADEDAPKVVPFWKLEAACRFCALLTEPPEEHTQLRACTRQS